jgi:predicted TIM-barrel fold metal-dependent hydrolase
MRVSFGSVTMVGLVLGVALLAQQPAAPQGGPQAQGAPAAGTDAPAARQGGRGRGGRGGGVAIEPGQECPPGMTEWRANNCRAPEPAFPVPSIVDYRPRSTLVAAEHPVPKAKYPAVDYHAHVAGQLTSPEALAGLVRALDSIGVGIAVSSDTMSGERLRQAVELVRNSPHRDRVRILTGINFSGVGPGWAQKAIAQLEADAKAGAVGVGEIGKGLGLSTRKADGTRLKIDDPDLDPVWAACARLNLPVFIHTADPPEFFQPIDMHNERWLELALFPDRRWMGEQYPTFEELMGERDRMFKKHPKTTFVAAHLAWYGNNLPRLAKLFDEMPNVMTELGAVLYDLGRQPRAAREFFIKYQDRILFGKDTFAPSEFPYYWRVFETADEYFDYYRDYHAFWKLYGMDLPDAVLRKVYYQNAVRITRGLPQTGWPR